VPNLTPQQNLRAERLSALVQHNGYCIKGETEDLQSLGAEFDQSFWGDNFQYLVAEVTPLIKDLLCELKLEEVPTSKSEFHDFSQQLRANVLARLEDSNFAPSAHWLEIKPANSAPFYLCGLAYQIDLGVFDMNWIGAFNEVDSFHQFLEKSHFVLSEQHLDELSDNELVMGKP
jgi:hypothetical protein